MTQGLNVAAVLSFVFASMNAYGQEALPYHDDLSRPVNQLPAGVTLSLRYSFPLNGTRLSPLYAQYGRIVGDALQVRMDEGFCMLAPVSPLPSIAVGTNLNGQNILVRSVSDSVVRTYARTSASYLSRTSFLINNDIAAGGSPYFLGIVCSSSGTGLTINDLQRAFGDALVMTSTLPADLGRVINENILNNRMAFTGWYAPMSSVSGFEGVEPGSCLGIALSNVAQYFHVDASNPRFVELLSPLLNHIRTRAAEIAPSSCAAEGSPL